MIILTSPLRRFATPLLMLKITLPHLDENVVEYTIGRWLKSVGDTVQQNEPILEVETDKVTMEVVAESAGTLVELLASEGDVLKPGALLAHLDTQNIAAPAATSTPNQPVPQVLKTVPEPAAREMRLSPVVARMCQEHKLEPALIEGSGKNGRVTKKDVLAYIEKSEVRGQKSELPVQLQVEEQQSEKITRHSPLATRQSESSSRIPLSGMRRSIAEHMVRSLATSPHVTTIFEFDFGRVAAHRAKNKMAFAADGVKLTYMAYLAAATVEALKKFPLVNSQSHDDGIELKKEINLGMIVAVPDGLYAPVIHHADEYNLKGLARAIGDLAGKAQSGQLTAADLKGGTFTISNHGAAGSIAGTPIIFQPQVGILGVGAIEDRVKVIDGGMHIRPCAYISFSFDHRVMDGAISDGFCSEIKRIIESWPE